MRTLLLLRHAKSAWDETARGDHERRLEDRGRLAAPLMGAYLAERGYAPARVLCSTARRARETWERAAPLLPRPPQVRFEEALYGAGADALLDRIRSLPDDEDPVLLVGHNPGLGELAAALARPGPPELAALRRKLPTAGLVALRFEASRWREVGVGQGELLDFTAPKDLV